MVGIADILTPPQLDLSLFYVFVILLATWNLGLFSGAAVAFLSGLMQWLSLSQHPSPVLHSFYWYFWLANRWFTFVIVVALTYPLRVMFDRYQAAARVDPLTEAANYKYFREILRMQLTRNSRLREPFAVVFMDCDDFKQINDRYGHAVGDSVLRAVVHTAKRHTRPSDTVARLGGDEFALLLSSVSGTNALAIVRRLQSAVGAEKVADDWSPKLSIGLACFDTTTLDEEGVIALCDSLMYRAKRSGKGQIVHEQIIGSHEAEGRQGETLSNGRT